MWGSYGCYEGPFYRGEFPYKPPAKPTENEKVLAVVAATEGRCDAINMYDGQIMSASPIQVVERAQYAVSDMLGAVADAHDRKLHYLVQETLSSALDASRATFSISHRGRWRFHFKDSRGEVDRDDEQRQLMHLLSDGKKGTWSDKDKAHGKLWAACVASVFEDEQARAVQAEWLALRLRCYAIRESKNFIYKGSDLGTPESLCFVAAYLTFAINNPTRANKHLLIGDKNANGRRFSRKWLIEVLKELTFGPHISIYPHRYNAIRPQLEKYYGVDLPDLAHDLEKWKAEVGFSWLPSTKELQMALIALGYDLGPRGADDDFGPKTTKAVLLFEQLHELPDPDGMPDPTMVQRLEQELEARGTAVLSD